MASRKKVTDLRKSIDALDQRILKLVSRRAVVAITIGKAKDPRSGSVLDIARERAVLQALRKNNDGPLSDGAVEAIFREIISACRAAQQPTSVAFLGPEGTFSHEAGIKQFGRTSQFHAADTIDDVFTAVESGRSAFGVVPVENTTEGAVTPTLDALAQTAASIIAEVSVRVEHCLLSKDGDVAKIRRIASHPQPLAQCRRYLAENFPGVTRYPTASTAAAAKLAGSRATTAAIASRLAGELYGLRVVSRSIQDNAANVTRFLVIGGSRQNRPSGNDRTSLVVSVRDRVGILEEILRPFAANKVNLSMIESRPLKGRPWEYSFFIDVGGHIKERAVTKAVSEVEKIAVSTKVLGSYPIAD